ncbi:MAG: (2Fe-2S)-binding protein [Pleurocapsa sp.]
MTTEKEIANKIVISVTNLFYAPARQLEELLANTPGFKVERISRNLEDLSNSDIVIKFITIADLSNLAWLTRSFLETVRCTKVQKLAWITPTCPKSSQLGKKLAQAANMVTHTFPDAFILHHAPLLSDLFQSNPEITFRRTLSLPLQDRSIPWLAPEDLVKAIYQWLLNKQKSKPPSLLTGAEKLTGKDLAEAISQALQRNLDSRRYALRCFREIDRDRNGQIDAKELYPYLFNLGYDRAAAQKMLDQADTNNDGAIGFTEFIEGLRPHLEKILADVPDRVQYVNVPPSTTLHDLIARGMPETNARSWLDWLAAIQTSELPISENASLWLGRPPILTKHWLERHVLNFINVYILPGRGILTLHEGIFQHSLAIYTRILQSDGRFLVGMHTLDGQAMDWQWLQEEMNDTQVVTYENSSGVKRILQLKDNKIVSLSVRGEWLGRHLATELFFEHTTLPRWQINLFRELGELKLEPKATLMESDCNICNCTQITYGELQKLIANGLDSLENLANITHITLICGGCQPLVEEMLGSAKLAVAELVSKQSLGQDIFRLTLRPVEQEVIASQPGQYILIQGKVEGIWRTKGYTLSSRANQTEIYEITVKRDELDLFSCWLCDRVDENSLLRISHPVGISCLTDKSQVYFFAAGMGVVPAIAMMRTLADQNAEESATEDRTQFHLDWSAPYPEDFVLKTELECLTSNNNNLFAIFRPTKIKGRITEADIGYQYPPNDKTIAFICGSPAYIDTVQEYLTTTGWSNSNIKLLAIQ